MGHGHPPGPWNGHGGSLRVDDGTAHRTEVAPPGAVGLKARGGGANQAAPPRLAERVTGFARRRLAHPVGNGQCFTLVDRALAHADALSARDFGEVSPDADYVWGTALALTDLRPGDIVQFRDYAFTRITVIENERGTSTEETSGDRPHHTAIVERVGAGGEVTVLEQNVPVGAPVQRQTLYFVSGSATTGNTTTTIRVSGTWWFYRPQSR
jgi:hypothetical protein